jgi:hypothetical protein
VDDASTPPAEAPPPTSEETPPAGTGVTASRRGRPSTIANSPHRDDYKKLLKAGWSSAMLERYAAFRYGEQISAPTIRRYRNSLQQKEGTYDSFEKLAPLDRDALVDVLGGQAQLIALQRARVAIDAGKEVEQKKLSPSVRLELRELAQLYKDYRETMQELGLFPRQGAVLNLNANLQPAPAPDPSTRPETRYAPSVRTLGELVAGEGAGDSVPEEAQIELARLLHQYLPVEDGGDDPNVEDAEWTEEQAAGQ